MLLNLVLYQNYQQQLKRDLYNDVNSVLYRQLAEERLVKLAEDNLKVNNN